MATTYDEGDPRQARGAHHGGQPPCRLGIVGVPHDVNSSFATGAREAPAAIRAALASDHWHHTTETGVDLAAERWVDHGDVPVTDLTGGAAYDLIHASVGRILAATPALVTLGGDHSIAAPVIAAHAERVGPLSVLQFDAHPDLYDDYDGNPYSHASPFARLLETGALDRLVQVGIRAMNAHQRAQADRFGVEVVDMASFTHDLVPAFDGPVYVSIDLDALDPAFAPGVSHHEPGGLSTRQVIDLVHRFRGRLVGADVVELNPQRDVQGITATVAAKLVKELLGRLVIDGSGGR